MTNYEFIKSLSKEDMEAFLCYVCFKGEVDTILNGFSVTNFKTRLALLISRYESYELSIEDTGSWNFLFSDNAYDKIINMSIEEMSGMFGLLSVSTRARKSFLCGGEEIHVLRGESRPCENFIAWLNIEVI